MFVSRKNLRSFLVFCSHEFLYIHVNIIQPTKKKQGVSSKKKNFQKISALMNQFFLKYGNTDKGTCVIYCVMVFIQKKIVMCFLEKTECLFVIFISQTIA